MFDIFDLVATLSLNSDGFEKGISDSESKLNSFGSKLSSGIGTAAKVATAATAAVAAGTVAVGTAMVKATGDLAMYGDEIDKSSQKIGISAQAYQEWDAILQHSGSSAAALRPAMKTLQAQAEKNSEAFQKLGISEEQVANMSKEELFNATITGLQNVADENERAALATDLLGKGAIEMGALLNTSAEDTEEMRKRVHELGGVMSDEAVKAAAKYEDTLQDMNTAVDSIKRNLISNFLPSVTSVMEGITEIFGGNMDAGLELIENGISDFIDKMSSALPKVIDRANAILIAIIQAISNSLPQIMQSGVQIVLTLVEGIVSNLPAIVNGAVLAIAELAKGLGQQLPTLIPVMVNAVITIVNALIENAPLLIDAALQLMIGLAEGLVNAIPVIIEKIPDIIAAIVKALIGAIPKIAEAGVKLIGSLVKNLPTIIKGIVAAIPKIISSIVSAFGEGVGALAEVGANLLGGLANGMMNAVGGVIDKARSIAGNIIGAVKGFFGVASPSKVFAEIGANLDKGMAKGILDNIGVVENAIDDLDDAIYDGVDGDAYNNTDAVTTVTTTSTDDGIGRRGNVEGLLNEILYSLQNMGIVLDGTTLVGHTSSRMNQAFGEIAYYNEREVWA